MSVYFLIVVYSKSYILWISITLDYSEEEIKEVTILQAFRVKYTFHIFPKTIVQVQTYLNIPKIPRNTFFIKNQKCAFDKINSDDFWTQPSDLKKGYLKVEIINIS